VIATGGAVARARHALPAAGRLVDTVTVVRLAGSDEAMAPDLAS
jgi:hypothetical protein